MYILFDIQFSHIYLKLIKFSIIKSSKIFNVSTVKVFIVSTKTNPYNLD